MISFGSGVALVATVAILLICIGLLIGEAWTQHLLQQRFRQHAEERRRLNAQWAVVHAADHRRRSCVRCAAHLPAQNLPARNLPARASGERHHPGSR